MEYKTLESKSLDALGIKAPTFGSNDTNSLLTTSTFIYSLLFTAIVLAAFYRYVIAGVYRLQASETSIRKSNEIFKQVTLGLLGVFSLFLILFTFNKGLVTGDVQLEGLKSELPTGGGGGLVAVPSTSTSTQKSSNHNSNACEPPDNVKAKLNSSGGICGGVSCSALSGCAYQKYTSIIDQEVGNDSNLRKMIIVTMCKESTANPTAQHNNGTSYDCGLMQVNQTSPCPANSVMSSDSYIRANIKEGVSLMRKKINASGQIYPALKVSPAAGAFSSYNCCSNKTVPNSPSVSCAEKDGWPLIPKWACPLDPGESSSNMCSVKSYVCDLVACMDKL